MRILLFFIILTFVFFAQTNDLKVAIEKYNGGKYSEAVVIFEKYIASGLKEKDIHLAAAECYVQLKDYARATVVLEKCRKLFPSDYNVSFILAQLYAQIPNYSAAVNILTGLARSYPDSASVKRYLSDVYLSAGVERFGVKDTVNAEKNFRNALLYNTMNYQARVNLLVILLSVKRYADALPFAKDGYGFFRNDTTIALINFEVLVGLEKFADALPVMEQLASAKPGNLQYQLNLAMLYRFNNLPDKALAVYGSARKNFPGEKDVYLAEVGFHQLFANDEQIISLYREYLGFHPDDSAIKIKLAKKFEKTGKFPEARDIYKTLPRESGDPSIDLLIAENFTAQGDTLAAISQIETIISVGSATPIVWLRLFELNRGIGDSQKAKAALINGLGSFPSSPEINLELAKIFYNEAKPDSALLKLDLIKEFSRDFPEISYYFALIFTDQGAKERAIFNYTRAIRHALRESDRLQTLLSGSLNNESLMNPDSLNSISAISGKFKLYRGLVRKSFDGLISLCTQPEFGEVIDELITDMPGAALLYLEKGKYLTRAGKTGEAEVELEKALILAPSTVEVQEAMGEFYELKGDFFKALDAFKRANGLDGSIPKFYRKIIDLSAKTGELNSLCDYWLQLYKTSGVSQILKEFLIEALQKADRRAEALQIINEK